MYEVEVPQLVLTSKINLGAGSGKGGIDLDWSSYDIHDKYFVIYRKEESGWKTIVGIEEKLCVNKYTDNFAIDKSKPSVPTSSISGDLGNNSINIDITSQDSGTKYVYYIEAYDSSDVSKVLATSNIIGI